MPRVRVPDLPLRRPMAAGLVALVVAVAASPAGAHETESVAGHAAEDAVVHTAAEEQSLGAASRQDTAADAAAAKAADGPPEQAGTWGPVTSWPVVGVHVALLPNGKVLAYDSVGDNAAETYADPLQVRSRATVWDPATGVQTPVDETGYNVFCSGLAHLVDGSIFLAGGNKNTQLHGIRKTHVFNPETNTWSPGNDMQADRWYPTVTALSDGRMLITSGDNGGEGDPATPEVRATDGAISQLSAGARKELPLYPWLEVAPDGRVVNVGPYTAISSLTVVGDTGSWSFERDRGDLDRKYGSHALYDVGKVLVAGGGDPGSPAGSTASARVVDLNGATATVADTDPMKYKRRQHNLTVLADGSVLATGGNSSGADLVDKDAGVYAAERWNPKTGAWTTLAAESRTRQYHSTALLLPDGRVLSSGGGICGICDTDKYLEKNAQVFTPPYLYDPDGTLATRPAITIAPSGVPYGGSMAIGVSGPAAISKVALIRLGAVTHSVNMDQRYVPLSFTAASATALTAVAPANPNIAPPGVYMLVAVDSRGVPSVAKMVQVGITAPANVPPVVSLAPPTGSLVAPATLTLTATASDEDGDIDKVEFFNGDGLKVGTATSAPYNVTVPNVPAGTASFTAKATDDDGAVTESAPVTVQIEPPPPSNLPPAVSLQSPAGSYTAPASIGLAATASDVDGTVAKVEFLRGSTVIATDTTAPYTATAGNVPAGTSTFTARATDDDGASTTSAQVVVLVSSPPPTVPPTVALTSPAPGTSLVAPATVQLAAEAADLGDAGSVAQVEFFVGSRSLGVDLTAPYTATAGDLPPGSYAFTARATDDLGASTTSAPVTVLVAVAPVPPLDVPPVIVPPSGGQDSTNPPAPAPRVSGVAVQGTSGATRRLRMTATAAVDVAVSLERVRGTRRTPLRGTRRVRVPAGTSTVSLREPWNGARLAPGRYRVAVRAGTRTVHVSFTVAPRR